MMRAPLVLLALLFHAFEARAQTASTQIVDGRRPTCAACHIELERVVTIGNPNDSVLLSPRSRPYRDRQGRFYAWTADRGRIALYDRSGALIRVFGRTGSGPGEFAVQFAPMFVMLDNSLVVTQPGKLVRFSATQTFIENRPFVGRVTGAAISLPDMSTIIPAEVATPSSAGLPLHRISASGELVGSFGSTATAYDRRPCGGCLLRHLTFVADRAPTIWAAHHRRYIVDKLDSGGRTVRRFIVRNSPWFANDIGEDLEAGRIVANPTVPVLRGLGHDSSGHLIVVGGAIRTGKVVRTLSPSRSGVARRPVDTEPPPRVDVIDALSARTGELIATLTIESPPFFEALEGDLLYRAVEDSSGTVRLEVWRVVVVDSHPLLLEQRHELRR